MILIAVIEGKCADAFDVALTKLVDDSVSAVEESGKRKLAVLDFTSIDGTASAFGKFLAEQVSVGLVTAKKNLIVVDRANLRSILAEQHLTEDGLVKPENAKKLGEFSGVDSLYHRYHNERRLRTSHYH